MVPRSRIEREMVDEISVRLEEGEPPVLVERAAVIVRTARSVVDRIAEADDEADVDGVGQALHGAGHRQLPVAAVTGADPHPEVAEGEEGDRIGIVGRGVRPEPKVERPGRRSQPPR